MFRVIDTQRDNGTNVHRSLPKTGYPRKLGNNYRIEFMVRVMVMVRIRVRYRLVSRFSDTQGYYGGRRYFIWSGPLIKLGQVRFWIFSGSDPMNFAMDVACAFACACVFVKECCCCDDRSSRSSVEFGKFCCATIRLVWTQLLRNFCCAVVQSIQLIQTRIKILVNYHSARCSTIITTR